MTKLLLSALLGCCLSASCAQALVVKFSFDDVFNGLPLDPPIVGTGTFAFDGDPGNGTFPLGSLANFEFFFEFGADTFATGDLATPVGEILVLIDPFGTDRRVRFGNSDPSGSGSGFFGGSLDFRNTANGAIDVLSFEPPFFGAGLELYVAQSNTPQVPGFEGSYLGLVSAAAVPEPGSLLLLGLGALGMAGTASARRRTG